MGPGACRAVALGSPAHMAPAKDSRRPRSRGQIHVTSAQKVKPIPSLHRSDFRRSCLGWEKGSLFLYFKHYPHNQNSFFSTSAVKPPGCGVSLVWDLPVSLQDSACPALLETHLRSL